MNHANDNKPDIDRIWQESMLTAATPEYEKKVQDVLQQLIETGKAEPVLAGEIVEG